MKEKAETIYNEIPELAIVEKKYKGSEETKGVRSFVLRTTPLHTFQVDAVRNYYSHYGLTYKNEIINYKDVFNNDNPVIVEIGFGMGVSTVRIAKTRSEYNYIGIEVFLNGFTKTLSDVGNDKIENVRLMRFDAISVLNDMLEDNSLAGFHIFFPDPWPKKKHNKRRLIQDSFASLLAKKLKKSGYIYCVTDWEEYAEQIMEVFNNIDGIKNPYEGYAPSRDWRPTTKYETRGVDLDYKISEVWFEKE
ncbi:MAG: tRNA (guanosine(46)-N7)-methyltransferase TrmB [Spirochaetaceae bacterium]|nr:tRNA (guanosine(46)-N7)-methyltransferase TrmB [Spirochaetaceae bacterium]